MKPLYKKGNTSDFSNYRPISLLTSFSKVIEKIIHKRLYHYLDQQKVFVNEQYGFRQKTSTETAAFSLLNTILLSLDKKEIVGGLFLDLQKAFDCVNHSFIYFTFHWSYTDVELAMYTFSIINKASVHKLCLIVVS